MSHHTLQIEKGSLLMYGCTTHGVFSPWNSLNDWNIRASLQSCIPAWMRDREMKKKGFTSSAEHWEQHQSTWPLDADMPLVAVRQSQLDMFRANETWWIRDSGHLRVISFQRSLILQGKSEKKQRNKLGNPLKRRSAMETFQRGNRANQANGVLKATHWQNTEQKCWCELVQSGHGLLCC